MLEEISNGITTSNDKDEDKLSKLTNLSKRIQVNNTLITNTSQSIKSNQSLFNTILTQHSEAKKVLDDRFKLIVKQNLELNQNLETLGESINRVNEFAEHTKND